METVELNKGEQIFIDWAMNRFNWTREETIDHLKKKRVFVRFGSLEDSVKRSIRVENSVKQQS